MNHDLLEEVKALDEDQRREVAKLLAPKFTASRRAFLGIAGLAGGVALSSGTTQAACIETTSPQVIRYVADGTTQAYALADYEDLATALQAAHDDSLAAGEPSLVVELPIGEYTVTNQFVCETQPYIIGHGKPSIWANDHPATTIINDTGDYWFILRGTSNSPDNHRINAGYISGFRQEPASPFSSTGGIFMDGTDGVNTTGSIVRGVTFERVGSFAFGQTPIAYEGTIFDLTFTECRSRLCEAPAFSSITRTGGSGTAGSPSQIRFHDCYFTSRGPDAFAVRPGANSALFLGGSIGESNGGSGIDGSGSGNLNVFGTHLEGNKNSGTVGLLLKSSGGMIYPAVVSGWETGVSVGESGDRAQVYDNRLQFGAFRNADADIYIADGGNRGNTWLMDRAVRYAIRNDRKSVDGVDDLYEVSVSVV